MSQLNKPTIKNPELVEAMETFKKEKTPENEKVMLEAIQAASFIAPVALQGFLDDAETDEEGHKKLQANMLAVTAGNGQKVFPAFTDWIELLKWKDDPEADTIVITFDQYCDLLLRPNSDVQGFVINPSETGIYLSRDRLAQIKGVTLPPAAVAPGASLENANINSAISTLFGANKISNPRVIELAQGLRQVNMVDQEQIRQQQQSLFAAMREAKFIVPAFMHDMPKEIHPNDKVNAKAEFIMLTRENRETHEKQQFQPIFTSMDELKRWGGAPKGCCGVPLPFTQIIGIISEPNNRAAGLVMDPFSIGITFPKEQLMQIAPRVELQDAKAIPLDMMNELKVYFADHEIIRKAYFSGVKVNGKDGYLIILDAKSDPQTINQMTQEILACMKKYCIGVVAPIEAPISQKAIAGKAPFYEA